MYKRGIESIGITVKQYLHTKHYRYCTHENKPVLQHTKTYRYYSAQKRTGTTVRKFIPVRP
jgi:hypothetical protein